MLGDFSISQNGQPILAQPNFHTLYKRDQCSLKHKLFSKLLVSYDRWDLQPSIHMKISRKFVTVFIWQTIKKCQLFFETPGRVSQAFSQRGVFWTPYYWIWTPQYPYFFCIMQWDEKELDTQFTQNVYFWTPNSQILAKALESVDIFCYDSICTCNTLLKPKRH